MSGAQVQRAVLSCNGQTLNCQFNPATLRISKTSKWAQHPAPRSPDQNAKPPQYLGSGAVILSGQLLFDDTGTISRSGPGVAQAVSMVFGWTIVPHDNVASHTPQPMPVTFRWGSGVDFTGFLTTVTAEYTMFAPDGKPTRATLDISLQLQLDSDLGTNPTSAGVPGRTSEIVRDGDSLASVAYKHYGDPNMWRALAVANGIHDPRRVPTGSRLLVPPRIAALALNEPGAEL